MTPEEQDRMLTKATNIWFPLLTVVSMVGFVAWSSWTVSEERIRLNTKIDGVSAHLTSLAATVEKLAMRVGAPDAEAMPKTQWVIDCLQMQILSKGIVVCPYAAGRQAWGAAFESVVR